MLFWVTCPMLSLHWPSQPLLGGCHPGRKGRIHCVGPSVLGAAVRDDSGAVKVSERGFCPSACRLSSAKYSGASSLSVLEMSQADTATLSFVSKEEPSSSFLSWLPAGWYCALQGSSLVGDSIQRIELMGQMGPGPRVSGHCENHKWVLLH